MKKEWIIEQNGETHTILYVPKKEVGEDKLYVDGTQIKIEKKSRIKFVGFDQAFTIEDKTYHFVVKGRVADIAVDGKYIDGKKLYHMSLKKWIKLNVLSIISLIIVVCQVAFQAPIYTYIISYFVLMGIYIWGKKSGMPAAW